MSKKRGPSVLALTLLLMASMMVIMAPVEADPDNINIPELNRIDSVRFSMDFDPSGVGFYDIGGLIVIQKDGMDATVIPGEPLVPVDIKSIVIDPYATEVEIEIISSQHHTISNIGRIAGVPEQAPISLPEERDLKQFSIPLEGPVRLLEDGYIRGYHIQDIAFQPIIPLENGDLRVFTHIEGQITFNVPDEDLTKVDSSLRITSAFRSYLQGHVSNPDEIDLYQAKPLSSPVSAVLSDKDVQYVIITNTSKVSDHLDDIKDWKNKKGVPTEIIEMSFIDDNYNGTDMQERVRNFIKDAVNTWDTEYILLGGDISVVPYRSTYVQTGSYIETDCAADLYYSDLDGSFDGDGDGIYGETTDSVDMRPDVIVGRAPAETSSEMSTFVTKTLKYELDPLSGYLDNVTLAGEFLDASTNSSLGMDTIKNTILPSNINATSLYDSAQGTFGNFNRLTYQAQVNKGLSYIFHSGHSNWNVMSCGTSGNGYLYNSHIPAYNGGYKIGVMNSLGCIANRFSQNDCIGELHVKESDGGSVVFIGNSRYGWYAPSSPGNGASETYMKRMATELFTNGYTHMGEHFAYAKNQYTGWSGSYNAYRWLQMALNMMGEPEMHVRTAEPQEFNITLPDSLGSSNSDLYITVRDMQGSVIQGALVCLEQSGYYGYALSGSNGRAIFNYSSNNYDKVNVTITGYNFIPFTGNISVDMIAPSIIINKKGNATTGDDYEFNCTAIDEAGIDRVFMDMRYISEDINDTKTYPLVQNSDNWTTIIPIPLDSTEELVFRMRARDRPGNWNETSWDLISVIDDDEPWFTGDTTPSSSTTGENISFQIGIEDNINVTASTLSVWWNKSADIDSIELSKGDLGWTGVYELPIDKMGELRYAVMAMDEAGNINSSFSGMVQILDNDIPIFIDDLTSYETTTSGTCDFRVIVEDNIAIDTVFVEYWRNGFIEHMTDPMVLENGTWRYSIELPDDDLDNVHHIFHAVDTSGNWNQTLEGTITIKDLEIPEFIMDWTPVTVTTGEDFEVRVEVRDNIQVNLVRINCPLLPRSMNMTQDLDGKNWSFVLTAPTDSLSPLEYSFVAFDPFDNQANTTLREIEVLDNDAPTFGVPLIPGMVNAGSNLTVYVDISDNIDVSGASLKWWLGGSSGKATLNMTFDRNWSTSFNIPRESFGTIYFTMETWDKAGNFITSDRFDVGIIEYIPPVDPGDDDDDDDDIITPVDDDDDDDDIIAPGDDDDDIPVTPAPGDDNDGDGMDDLWEYENELDHTLDDRALDADEDGYTNLEEFEAGTDPQDETSMPLPTGSNPIQDEVIGDLLLVIVVGFITIGLVVILGVAMLASRRRSKISNEKMVLEDDDDEVMSWD